MSKLKRKWIKVIESEENGTPLEDSIRAQVMETHPNLPILQRASAPEAPMMAAPLAADSQASEVDGETQHDLPRELPLPQLPPYHPPAPQQHLQQADSRASQHQSQTHDPQLDSQILSQQTQQRDSHLDSRLLPPQYSHQDLQHYPHPEQHAYPHHEPQSSFQGELQYAPAESQLLHHQARPPPTDPQLQTPYYGTSPYEQHISPQIEQELRRHLARADAPRSL